MESSPAARVELLVQGLPDEVVSELVRLRPPAGDAEEPGGESLVERVENGLLRKLR
jgi:hypothetical protein